MLRILLGVNLCVLTMALAQSRDIGEWMAHYVVMAAWAEPLLFFGLVLLWPFARFLRRLPVRRGQAAVILLVVVSALLQFDFWRALGLIHGGWQGGARKAVLAALTASGLLLYFEMRARTFSPALSEARLQALTARIRPHFLFNSLNAVLSLIRSEPRRAERALEEIADLFRALMRDPRDLVPLTDEIALCRQYLDLEKLRLGDRLEVVWDVDAVPPDVDVPPLVLQPLLENAVYHGIEPSGEAGTIRIGFTRKDNELRGWLVNPCRADAAESKRGNGMALDNIRERLSLYYDLEARLETRETILPGGAREYRVDIVLPYREPRS